ncbi:MAG: amidohydrolase, partial [Candidatus Onthomonas sp.]|nr:amidohydrolase [Candidatus Onthomonas sp.]
MILKNIRIFPMDRPPIERGYVAFEDGKITALGPAEDCPAGEGLDLSGAYLYPGLIDAHCHVGMFGDSVGAEGRDGNEST